MNTKPEARRTPAEIEHERREAEMNAKFPLAADRLTRRQAIAKRFKLLPPPTK